MTFLMSLFSPVLIVFMCATHPRGFMRTTCPRRKPSRVGHLFPIPPHVCPPTFSSVVLSISHPPPCFFFPPSLLSPFKSFFLFFSHPRLTHYPYRVPSYPPARFVLASAPPPDFPYFLSPLFFLSLPRPYLPRLPLHGDLCAVKSGNANHVSAVRLLTSLVLRAFLPFSLPPPLFSSFLDHFFLSCLFSSFLFFARPPVRFLGYAELGDIVNYAALKALPLSPCTPPHCYHKEFDDPPNVSLLDHPQTFPFSLTFVLPFVYRLLYSLSRLSL